MKRLVRMVGLAAVLVASTATSSEPGQRWDFNVFLDDKPIGEHSFQLFPAPDGTVQLTSRASFDVRFLFFVAYQYRHRAQESWRDGCLERISAQTDANGKETAVTGHQAGNVFQLRGATGTHQLEAGCVMTFAYWNREFLDQSQLLNPQTGQYLDVDVSPVGSQPVIIEGESVTATGFRVEADGVDVVVWYAGSQWIALESTVRGNRILRYEIKS